MIPDYPLFKPLDMVDYDEIAAAISAKNQQESELSPSSLCIWQDFLHPSLTRINGNTCIMLQPFNESPFFLEPLSDKQILDTVSICLKHAKRLSQVSERFAQNLPLNMFHITPVPNQFDYLYLRRDLAELAGKKYDGKRNHIKRFIKNHPIWTYVPLSADLQAEAMALFEAWCLGKPESSHIEGPPQQYQRFALSRAFKCFDGLAMRGGAIYSSGKMRGFILGSVLGPSTVIVHFQYGLADTPGIMPLLLQQSAEQTFADFEYMNLEQDIGIAGLRQSKLSYHPCRLIKKFEVQA